MFRSVFSAEFRRQARNPVTVLAALILALVCFNDMSLTSATASGLIRIGRVSHNAPLIVAELLTAVTVPSMFLVALLVGPSVQRDFANRCYAFYFTTPMTRWDYLGGRFLGGLTAILVLPVASLLGMAVAWSFIPSDFLGPFQIVGLFQAFTYSIPTLLFFAALFFSVATLTRSTAVTYVAAVITMILAFVVQGIATEVLVRGDLSSAVVRWCLLLADATGRAPLAAETYAWSVAERSTRLLPFGGVLVLNRLVWSAAAVALFFLTGSRFSLVQALPAKVRRQSLQSADTSGVEVRPAGSVEPRTPTWGRWAGAHMFIRLTTVELGRTLRHLVFLVLAGVMTVQLYSNFVGNVVGAGIQPRTGLLLNAGLDGVDAPIIIITLFFAGVLVWKERELGEDAITHALPMSNLVHMGSRFAVLVGLQAACAILIIAVGLFAQVVLFGYTDVQPDLYAKAVLGIHLLGWVQIAAGMFFLQVLAPSKTWGFGLCAVAVLWSAVSPSLGLTASVYRFGAVPSFVYSDMNGFGPFAGFLVVYRVLWSFVAALLFIGAVSIWKRGVLRPFAEELRGFLGRMRRHPARLAVPGVAAAFLFVHVVRIDGSVWARDVGGLDLLAVYEAENKHFEDTPQPTVSSVSLAVDLFPEARTADIVGVYGLVNRTEAPVEAVHITLLPTALMDVPVFELDRPSRTVSHDRVTGFSVLALDSALAPGDSLALTFRIRVGAAATRGGSTVLALVENGTVLDNFVGHASFFPLVGYRRELEVQDPRIRTRHGLDPEAGTLRSLDDPEGPMRATRSWVRFAATISTELDQTALTAGSLIDSWTEGRRTYARFVSDTLMANEFAIVSGRYSMVRDTVRGVDVQIYHHPDHGMNVRRMAEGIRAGLGYAIDHFGAYPYRSLKVVEIPAYGTVDGTAVSKPGMLLWNETGGFVSAPAEEDVVDPVFSTAAHESAHQWWAHQVRPAAFVEGALTLNETLAQYVRLQSLRSQATEAALRSFLRAEGRAYTILRGRALSEERPLMSTTNGYVAYNKGSLAMDAMVTYLGEDAVNEALRSLVTRFALAGPPYPTTQDLLDALDRVAPDSLLYLVEDWFESITLYDNRLVAASSVLSDGRWRVDVEAEFHKLRADGRGETREVPYRGQVDVGVYDGLGALLALETLQISTAFRRFSVQVPAEPVSVVLDPFGRLTDPNPDDNTRTAR